MPCERDNSSPGAVVESWFELWADDVHRYAARRIGESLAADVVADTFRFAIERHDQFDAQRGTPRQWLLGISTNLIRNHWRTERRRLGALTRLAAQTTMSSESTDRLLDRLVADDRLRQLSSRLAALNQDDVDVLVLNVWEEMTSTEIATVLGIPAGTARSRLHRVRRILEESAPAAAIERTCS